MSSSILLLFDVFGTFVFALSGAAKAISKKMDFLGKITGKKDITIKYICVMEKII